MDPAIVWTVVCCQAVFLAVLVSFCRPRSTVEKSEPVSYTWENFLADVEAGIPIDIIHQKCLRFGVPRRPKVASLVIPSGTLSVPWLTNVGIDTSTFTISNNGAHHLNLSVNNMPLAFKESASIQRYQ